jgi:hypothetical protein
VLLEVQMSLLLLLGWLLLLLLLLKQLRQSGVRLLQR